MDSACGDDLRLSLAEFANDVFAPLRRAVWRERSEVYVRRILLGEKRRRRPFTTRLPQASRDQALNHFVSVSPWDHVPVRRKLTERILTKITPDAWVLGQTTFPKCGEMLAGVARQDTGESGRVANCQVGISAYLASEDATCPVDWRLFLPECWDPTLAKTKAADLLDLRTRTGIPKDARYRPKWQLAVDMLDEMAIWGFRPPVVVTDRQLDGGDAFASALESRGVPYLLEVDPEVTARPEADPRRRLALRDIVTGDGPIAPQILGWRQPVKDRDGRLQITQYRFLFVPVSQPWSDIAQPGGATPPRWLVVEWPTASREPSGYWLGDLPADFSLSRLARLTRLQRRVTHDERGLVDELGLGRYKGRTWAGWHHHVTLVSAAHAFRVLQRFEPAVPAQLRSRQPSSALR